MTGVAGTFPRLGRPQPFQARVVLRTRTLTNIAEERRASLRPPHRVDASVPAACDRVAAIVVTWNRREAVSAVLRAASAQSHGGRRIDMIVVDNASTDGTFEHLVGAFDPEVVVYNRTQAAHEPRFEHPGTNGRAHRNALGFHSLTVIRNDANMGGCGGFNTGLSYVDARLDRAGSETRPDAVWLIDDDVDLPVDALAKLVETLDSDASVGVVGSRAVDYHDRATTIETTIYFDFERGRMSETPLPSHRLRAGHDAWVGEMGGTRGARAFAGVREVDVVSACSLLARWSAVREVGFWDYRYFIYCDDADWCLRFARAGYKVACNLDAVVYHTPWFHKLTPARLYYSQRNVVWVMQKVLPPMRLKYATLRWLASIQYDCLLASMHRRVFHAEIIRRTADDIISNHGGKLDDEGPAKVSVMEALRQVGAGAPGARVAVLCKHPDSLRWSAELRARAAGEGAIEWIEVVRDDVPGAREHAEGVKRIVYSRRLRSRLWRQAPLVKRSPAAVVVFDQTNDVPLLRGRWNIHIDRKWPDVAQVERDGLGQRAAFLRRWIWTTLRCAWYAMRVRPYVSPSRYG